MPNNTINIDDAGMHPDSNQKILELAQHGAINSVSCFVGESALSRCDVEKLQQKDGFKIGLHLDLTESFKRSLCDLILGFALAKIKRADILREFSAQIDRFIELYGFFPHHIDSHQHVHQIPFIRGAFVDVIVKYQQFAPDNFYVRCTDMPILLLMKCPSRIGFISSFKNAYLKALGASFKRVAVLSAIPTNRYLFGTYSFSTKDGFKNALENYYSFNSTNQDLFYSHAGASNTPDDVISTVRAIEFDQLMASEQHRL